MEQEKDDGAALLRADESAKVNTETLPNCPECAGAGYSPESGDVTCGCRIARILDALDETPVGALSCTGLNRESVRSAWESLRVGVKRLEAAESRSRRMREALVWIAAQEDYTFTECSLAEEIIRRARAASEA